MSRWILSIVCGLAIALALYIVLNQAIATSPTNSSASAFAVATGNPILDEATAIANGVSEAKQLGLQGEPWGVSARQMTLGEYRRLEGGEISPEATRVGIDRDQPIWLLVIRGSVDLRGKVPGFRTGDDTRFDNMILVLDARTGRVMGYPGARNAGWALPIPVSVTPGAPTEVPTIIPVPSSVSPRVTLVGPPRVAPTSQPWSTPHITPGIVPSPVATLTATIAPSRLPAYPIATAQPFPTGRP